VTDVGVLELTAKSLPLEWLRLNGVVGLTDTPISAVAKSCSHLTELELCGLPLLTAVSVRDIWTFSRKLRTLRLARCALLTDKAFPVSVITSPLDPSSPASLGPDKPLPPRPSTWLDDLPPLILTHNIESLRILDLTDCAKLTDEAIEGIVTHAPKIQTLVLSGCKMITDRSVRSICHLGGHLNVLVLAHAANITDRAIVKLARSCSNLRSLDVACELDFNSSLSVTGMTCSNSLSQSVRHGCLRVGHPV
jgi:F-box and leucine-rich repeat protein GRR1